MVAELIAGGAARRARHRARPRAGQHRHEPDHPEERRRREGRSAGDLLQQDAGGARQHRRRSDLEPDHGQRPEVRRQHQLGSVRARRRPRRYYLRATTGLAEGDGRCKGPWTPAGTLPESFTKLPADDELEGRRRPRCRARRSRRPRRPRCSSARAGRADSAEGRAELSAGRRHAGLLWVSNTESDVFRLGKQRPGLLPGRRPLVLGARLHRAVDVRDADAAGRLQADPARARRARACWRRCPGTTQAAEAVLLAQIPQTARVGKKT